MIEEEPVSAPEFADAMAALGLFPGRNDVAVAVSGGPDSMALVHLAARWGRAVALIVDHGLRPGSGDEAMLAADRLARAGIRSHILKWEGDKPVTGLQAAARAARYRLLEARCRASGIASLLIAHHRDDQAETLLLRLARGSGLRGLSGMAPRSGPVGSPGETLPMRYRPLLGFPKSRLIATCAALGIEMILDPSNLRAEFDRTAARQLLASPPVPGISATRLAATATRLGRAAAALDHYVSAHIARVAAFYPEGYARLDPALLVDAPEEVALRALSCLVQHCGGAAYPPPEAAIMSLRERLEQPGFRGATLAGARLLATTRRHIIVCREYGTARQALNLQQGESAVFERRFHVSLDQGAAIEVDQLGPEGAAALAMDKTAAAGARCLPYAVRISLPAAFRDGRPVAVPHLGFGEAGTSFRASNLVGQFDSLPETLRQIIQ